MPKSCLPPLPPRGLIMLAMAAAIAFSPLARPVPADDPPAAAVA